MTIRELVEFTSNDKNKLLKPEQLQEAVQKKIETKKYIKIKDKKELIEHIIEDCILYEDGIYKFDEIEKYICFTMRVIEAYTNIELSEYIEDDYDMLCESMSLNTVINTFAGEYENIKLLLQMKCDYILNQNNIEVQVSKFLTSISDEVGKIANVASDKIQNFDINKLPFKLGDINKLLQFLNSQK
jgi:hypothetical protein